MTVADYQVPSGGIQLVGVRVRYAALRGQLQRVRAPVHASCMGMAASAERSCSPPAPDPSAILNARIMMHQPIGGARGSPADIHNQASKIA